VSIIGWASALSLPLVYAAILWAGGAGLVWLGRGRSPLVVVFGAIPVAVVLVGSLGLAQMWFDYPFGWLALGVAYLLAALLAIALGVVVERTKGWWNRSPRVVTEAPDDPRGIRDRVRWLEGVGILAMSTIMGLSVLWLATDGLLDMVSQTWDAMFDSNAVRFGFDHQNVSPTLLSSFPYPDGTRGSYYPSTFHALCVLYMQLAGTDAVIPTNVVAGLIGGTIWPSATILASAYAVGARRWVLWASAVLAWGFYAAPWSSLGWGVLWATALAAAVSPIALAGMVSLLGWSPVDRPWRLSALVTAVGLGFVGFMHPRILVIIVVVGAGLWVWTFAVRAVRARQSGTPWRLDGALAAAPVPVVLFVVFFVARGIEARQWLVEDSLPVEFAMHLANGVTGSLPQLGTAILVLLGAWWALRSGRSGLAVLWLGVLVLDIITARFQGNFAVNGLARFWYNDRHRVLPLTAFPALLLALVAVGHLRTRWLARSKAGAVARPADVQHREVRARWLPTGAVVVALASALVVANGLAAAVRGLRVSYANAANDPKASLVSPQEIALYHRIAEIVPRDERIMNNANDGSALLYAYVDRQPIFLIAGVRGSTYNSTSAFERFNTLSHHDFCVLVHEDHLGWLYNGGRAYSGGVILEEKASGLKIPPEGHWALTPVLVEGERTLYKITGCGPLNPL